MSSCRATNANPHAAAYAITIGSDEVQLAAYTHRLDLHPATFGTWVPQAKKFLVDAVKYDSTTLSIFVAGGMEAEHAAAAAMVVELAKHHYHHARINQNTVEVTGEKQGRNFARNLAGMQWSALETLPSMAGQTCVIVGAGPSLDRDIEQLRTHRGPILAVNTSAGALARAGIVPTAIVSNESKPITEGLALAQEGVPVFFDATANPDNVKAARGPVAWFCGTEPNLAEFAHVLGLLPLAYGPSCTTAAVALALAAGAERVALVGQDCALEDYGQDGPIFRARSYAKGTPYEHTSVELNVTTMRATVEGPHKPRTEQDVVRKTGNDGRDVFTTYGMLAFAEWFQALPEWTTKRIVNCTSGGAVLEGIARANLADVVSSTEYEGCYQPSREMPSREVAKHLETVAALGIKLAPHTREIVAWASQHPILHMWLSPEILRMRRETAVIGPIGKTRRLAPVVARACLEIADALGMVRRKAATEST